MVYYDKKKRKYFLGNPPLNKKVKIESPPAQVPIPTEAKYIAWNELTETQCQFHLDTFWDGPSNSFPCCGLTTKGGNGLGRRFCEYHAKVSEIGVLNVR